MLINKISLRDFIAIILIPWTSDWYLIDGECNILIALTSSWYLIHGE